MNINLFAPLCSSDPIVPEGNDRKERFSNWLVREMGPMFEVWWQALLSAAVFILNVLLILLSSLWNIICLNHIWLLGDLLAQSLEKLEY